MWIPTSMVGVIALAVACGWRRPWDAMAQMAAAFPELVMAQELRMSDWERMITWLREHAPSEDTPTDGG